MALRLRRGTDAERLQLDGVNGLLPAEGELLYTTDTKRLYVGDGATAGGIAVDTGLTTLNASSIDDLLDVDTSQPINTPNNGDILTWDSATTVWSPSPLNIPSDVNELTDVDNLLVGGGGGGGVVEGSYYRIGIVADDSTIIVNTATQDINAIRVNADEVNVTGTITGDVTGDLTGNTLGIHTGYQIGDMTGSVFADDSTLLVDGVNRIVTADVVGDVTADLVTSNDITLDKAGIPTLTLTNNQPSVNLYDGDTHGVLVFKTIDTNGTRTSGTFGVADTGFVFTAGDGAGGLPVANKLAITQDGKFGLGTTTPSATLDVQGAIMPGVYADAAARDAAIPTPVAGMMVYVTDVNKHQGYNGTTWTDMY